MVGRYRAATGRAAGKDAGAPHLELIINVGDTDVIKEFAGTFFQGQYSGSTDTSGTVTRNGNLSNVSLAGNSSGTMTGMSTPMHRYSRQTMFKARLVDPTTAKNIWVGSGEVSAGGRRLFVGNGSSVSSSVSAILDYLRARKIIGGHLSFHTSPWK